MIVVIVEQTRKWNDLLKSCVWKLFYFICWFLWNWYANRIHYFGSTYTYLLHTTTTTATTPTTTNPIPIYRSFSAIPTTYSEGHPQKINKEHYRSFWYAYKQTYRFKCDRISLVLVSKYTYIYISYAIIIHIYLLTQKWTLDRWGEWIYESGGVHELGLAN